MNENRTPRQGGYRMPAEWAPHRATWMAWPHNESDWPGRFGAIVPLFVEMIRELGRGERVRLLVEAGTRERASLALRSGGADLDRVDFVTARTNRSWTRDYVPSFVVGERGLAAVKWRFNGWARYDDYADDEAAGVAAVGWLGVPDFRPVALDGREPRPVVMEGGAIDVDGAGTVLASESCLLGEPYGRNRWLGKGGTERVFAEYLGAERVIWLPGAVAGDDTSGHVDDFARFVARGRVALCIEDDPRDENYVPLSEARERLEGARDAAGRRIDIVKLPMPRPVVVDGERLPATYANFYIANEVVLVPTFDDPMDRAALGILGELFGGRRVVGVRATDLVLGFGTIHCSTQQEPRGDDGEGRQPGGV